MSAAPVQSPPRRHSVGRLMLLAVALVLVLAAPVLVAPFTPWPGAAGMFMAGALPGAVSCILGGRRLAWGIAAALVVLVPLAIVLGPYPWLAGLYLGLLAVLAGQGARWGWHTALVLVPAQLSFLLVSPAPLGPGAGVPEPRSAGYLAAATALAVTGALWTGLILPMALARAHLPAPKDIAPLRVWWYSVILGVLCGLSTVAVLALLPGSDGAWLLLTLLMLIRPTLPETARRTWQRVLGTVLGGVLAAVLATLIPSQTVLFYLGLLSMAMAISTLFGPRYWLSVTLLTPAVVFFASPGTDLLARDLERVGFTVLGAAIVALTGVVVSAVQPGRPAT